MPVDVELRKKLRAGYDRLVEKGLAKDSDEDGNGFPVSIIYPKEVPIRGNVHIGLGRAISRSKINKDFAR